MDTQGAKWSTLQVCWLALWFVSIISSGFYYLPRIVAATKHAGHVCGLGGIGNLVANLIKPEQWLGLFTIALTLMGLRLAARAIISKWSWIDDYKWVAAGTLGLVLLLLIHNGCSN